MKLKLSVYEISGFQAYVKIILSSAHHQGIIKTMALIIAFATIISTFLGGLFAIRFKDKLHLILGFSAGAVLGVALFDLIPESLSLAQTFDTSLVTLLVAVGFIFYLILDRLFSLHCHGEICENPEHRSKLGAVTLIFHSFLDGLGIGLAFKISPSIGWIVAAAVLAHDFSDGINTVNMILRNQGNRRQALLWLAADAIAPAVGVAITLFFSVSEDILGLILAIFAGLFLYLGASDLIPESHHRHPAIWTSVMTVVGILFIYAIINLTH
jgi:ZIP family zinc transporter